MKLERNLSKIFLLWIVWLVNGIELVQTTKEKDESLSYVFTRGDVMIGGLSPVHFSPTEAEEQQNPNSFTCQGRLNTRGFEAVEAMLFTMDMLNEGPLKDLVLPNITIGMDIKDTCGSADYAVRESLNFTFISNAHVQDQCSRLQREKNEEQTIAVVGAAYSGVSMAVTNLCGLFYVPVISYASTSSLLSNKNRFRYFLRTVPNDMLQAKVMSDFVRAMRWNYVITLASDSEYGRSGIEAFKRALGTNYKDNFDVCIPIDERFTKRSTDAHFEAIFKQMKANPKARVIILFAQLHDADILIGKFRQQKHVSTERYAWIGSDAWADSKQVLKGNERVLNGMFGVVPEVVHIKGFDKYFTNFNDNRRKRNPWMKEYEYLKVAHDPAFHRHTFKHYPKAQFVMDAVLATAYALHNMLGCESHKDCSDKLTQNLKVRNLLDYLQSVRFSGMSRDLFSFDKLGDAIGVYDIKHLTLVDANYEFVNVGKWGAKQCDVSAVNGSITPCLELDYEMVDERLRNNSDNGIPFSTCSRECPMGYHKNPEKNHAKCCWHCRSCSGNTITNGTNMDDCDSCPRGYWANKNHSRCDPIQPTSLNWSDTLGVIIICISGAGVLAVICTFAVYYIYRETPVVRASSKELCYVLLLGIAWCFLTPVVFLAERTDPICRAIPFVTGLCPSLIAGTLLTKTNRISRIFNRKLLKTGTPSFLSKKWQLLMVICLAVVECLIGGGCVLFNDTGSKLLISDSKKEVLKQCKDLPDICTAIWWVYNAGLALTCTYQAFRTRKLPENYNEAKFITFTMVITCIVVTIFIPTYIGTRGIYRTTITCFVFIIGGFSTLCCMFVPKLYIILWRPEKNVPMQPRSSTIRLGTISPSASFVRRLSVDSTIETVKEGRKTRIQSLPVIQFHRVDDDGDAAASSPVCKKTKRSFSHTPDMLWRHRASPQPSPDRHAFGRRRGSCTPQFHVSMEMIEEGSECENYSDNVLLDSEELFKSLEQIKGLNNQLKRVSLSNKPDTETTDSDSNEYCEIDGLLSSVDEENVEGDVFDSSHEDDSLQRTTSTTCISLNDSLVNDKESQENHNQRQPAMPELFQRIIAELNLICSECGATFQSGRIRNEVFLEALCKQLSKNRRTKGEDTKLNRGVQKGLLYNIVRTPDFQCNRQCEHNKRKRKLATSKADYRERVSEENVPSVGLDVNENKPFRRLRNPSYLKTESLSLPSLASPTLEEVGFFQLDKTGSKVELEVKRRNRSVPNRHHSYNSSPPGDSVDKAPTPKAGLKCNPYTNGNLCHVTNEQEHDVSRSNTFDFINSDQEIETVL